MDKEEKPLLPQDGQKKREEKKAWLQAMYMALGVLFLIGIWDLIWSLANKAFPEFFYTIGQMFILMGQPSVWEALGLSVGRIIITLAIVTVLGSLLGLLSAFFHPLEEILKPFIYFLTAFPTASIPRSLTIS
jgi:ABC-type nitrate/sulfonate/bicarbonate transport system permease component